MVNELFSTASLYANEVTFSIQSENTTIIADEDSEYTFSGEVIGTISAAGRPSTVVVLDHTNNGNIPEGVLLMVEPAGAIRFAGTIIIATENEALIELNNITYTI
jgi:hypothetical protein